MCWLSNFGDFYWIVNGWFIKLWVKTLQPLIVMYRKGNFVYHHWGCISIYWLLSYTFRSLNISTNWVKFIFQYRYPCQKSSFFYSSESVNIIIRNNGFIITWILHQIFMYSNKMKLVAGYINDIHPWYFVKMTFLVDQYSERCIENVKVWL